jgi:molecular chaperone GrpE
MKIPIYSSDDPQQGEPAPRTASGQPEAASAGLQEADAPAAAHQFAPSEARIQALEASLAQKTEDYDATREQLLRLMADFDNYRKRMTRQHEEARQLATADVVLALLPGLDNLERALSAARQDMAPSSATIAEGVSMVLRQLKDALGKVGVRDVPTQGLAFDPTRHEAVDIVNVPAPADGMIVEEVQHGYLLHDRLLRPAKVVVGRAERDASPGGA